ncbi:MAG TPA: LPS export ABC transporter periplasmic protein LptC [Rhodocyclaceae bacterium]|nr:LPS export ABC transporter periplasmic protein LptC [Rhodocyclaceae bacterium]
MRLSGSSALFPLLVLAMLAGFTFWLENASQADMSNGGAKTRHDADFWVDDFTMRRFDVEGAVQHVLTSKRLEHFPDDESTNVTAPRLNYFGDRQTTVTAKTAWLDKEGKHVRLEGDVRIVRPGEANDPETIITTSVLHVMPDDERAYTQTPVTLTQGQTMIHGTGGLEVNNKTQIAVLSGPVQGTIYRKDK